MDAVEFAKNNIEELKARLEQAGDPNAHQTNFKRKPDEIVEKFLKDQGLTFTNIDVKKILGLVK
jgi:hypothetical protein